MKNRTYQDPRWGTVTIATDHYRNGGGLAVELLCKDGESLTTLSANFPESRLLPADCFYAKTYSENEQIAPVALASGWFEQVAAIGLRSGFCEFPIWRLNKTNERYEKARDRLVHAAAVAAEVFGEDELERWADEHAKEGKK